MFVNASSNMKTLTFQKSKSFFFRRTFFCIVICICATIFIYHIVTKSAKVNNIYFHSFLHEKQIPNRNTCSNVYFTRGIEQLPGNIQLLSKTTLCASLHQKFSLIYQVEVYNSSQKFGDQFSTKMNKWLGNNKMLMKLAEHQTVIMIHDILRQRTTVFNPLRSKRPVSNAQTSLITYLKNITESSKVACDFCSPFNMTAEDNFGRIRGKFSVSASNAFKLSKWHSLFIPFEHSMFNINMDIHLDMFNTSLKWFKKVHRVDKNAKFPVFFMDVFPHSGASQIHVHAHGVVGVDHYPGQFGDLLKVARSFQHEHSANYWETIFTIHETLGLSHTFGKVFIISPLVPQREHEFWLLCEEPSLELFKILFYIIKMYQDHFQKFCFSMSGALPILGKNNENVDTSHIALIFIGTRGDCSASTSDISSLELYLFNNVNTDPFQTMATLQKNIDFYSEKFKSDLQMEDLRREIHEMIETESS